MYIYVHFFKLLKVILKIQNNAPTSHKHEKNVGMITTEMIKTKRMTNLDRSLHFNKAHSTIPGNRESVVIAEPWNFYTSHCTGLNKHMHSTNGQNIHVSANIIKFYFKNFLSCFTFICILHPEIRT